MSFKYLASPYTHQDKRVREGRYLQAMAMTVYLATQKVWVYSPIVHSHHMCLDYPLPHTFEWWDAWNRAMIDGSDGMIVLQLEGWEQSKGVTAEIVYCSSIGKPISYMHLRYPHEFNINTP